MTPTCMRAKCATVRMQRDNLLKACDSAAQQAQFIVDNHDDLKKKGNDLQVLAIRIRNTLDKAIKENGVLPEAKKRTRERSNHQPDCSVFTQGCCDCK